MVGDALERLRSLPSAIAHACITSPPYFGLRDYGVAGQLGLEKTPEEYVERLVKVFREVRRVLRDDAVLALNLGDSYAGVGKSGGGKQGSEWEDHGTDHVGKRGGKWREPPAGLKPGDLLGIPWRVAFALQAASWTLRAEVIWVKAVEGLLGHVGTCMPESVNGTRWERHKVKVAGGCRGREDQRNGAMPNRPQQDHDGRDFAPSAIWEDCPGCPKCEPTGGYVLRQGSWRPTRAHEQIFLLSKGGGYFTDAEAVKEPTTGNAHPRGRGINPKCLDGKMGRERQNPSWSAAVADLVIARNPRDCWAALPDTIMLINPEPTKEKHYATFPRALVRRLLLALTSEKVCGECGAPYAPVVEQRSVADRPGRVQGREGDSLDEAHGADGRAGSRCTLANVVLGYRATCSCAGGVGRALVLDPFMGSGTTALVAEELGRDWIGIDLNPRNTEIYRARRESLRRKEL